jgi:murein L,D-transpeptidase YcbB/YkuD
MAPNLPQYVDLKRILADYRQQAGGQKEEPKLTSSKTLKPGDTDPEVTTLRQILVLHRDLSPDQATGETFDAEVAAALREFQKRYSLEPDGAVGNKTRDVLNYPIQERIKRVIVNMERLRWLPDDLGHKHIIVNVAGYVLHGFEEHEATIVMPVIVGRPDRRTPLFYAALKNIILNPSWGVPHSIFMYDKLPKIRKDPGYVRRANFTITDSRGKVIDPDHADWAHEGKKYFLRQSPGRHNALGQIKFNIENPYTIYLHGTPDQHLFSKKARALSSGCIRLKNPLKLAAWILSNDEQWSCDTIETAINKGETQTVKPAEYVPVYFTYQTIWVKENEKGRRIFHSNDPYQLDAKMIKMLDVRG